MKYLPSGKFRVVNKLGPLDIGEWCMTSANDISHEDLSSFSSSSD